MSSIPTFSFGRLGRTGVPVFRLGLPTSATIATDTFEYAMERGINYFYWGWARDEGVFRGHFVEAFRNQSRIRDRLVLVIWYLPSMYGNTVLDMVLRNLNTDYVDGLLLSVEAAGAPYLDLARKLKERGLVRWIGVTDRILGQLGPFPEATAKCSRAAAELLSAPDFDVFQVDFPATMDALRDVRFWPRLPAENPPGIVVTRAANRSFLSSPAPVAQGIPVPSFEDCYRFALSNPDVSVCMCAAEKRSNLDRALTALEKGPMTPEEQEWMRAYRLAVALELQRIYGSLAQGARGAQGYSTKKTKQPRD